MANPSRFEKLQITDNVQTTTATKVVFQETNGVLNTKNIDTSIIEDSNNPITSGAVYDALSLAAQQLELKSENSASALSGFEITNNGNGTLNINGGVALLRDQNDPYAILQKYTISGVTNLAMVDNANNFVLVDYNSGTPAIIVTQNPDTVNGRTNSIIAGVSRVGTTLDYISLVGQGVDSWQKIRSRFLDTETVTRAKGLELGASGLAISCTAGIAYAGLNKLPVSLLNTHTQAHRNGSAWVRTTGLTNLNNTQYNNAGTLTTLTNGRFRVDYVYVLVDNPSKLYTIMGEQQYNTIADARLAAAPAVLPTELQFLGVRVGRLIVEKSATTIEVSSEFNTVYRAGSVQNHNDLALLNTGNYNHFRATTSADAGKVLSVNSLGVADFATIPKAQFLSGELVDQLTIATATTEEKFQLNSQPLVSNKHTFTLASGVVFPVTVHIETKAGSPSGYDGTAVIAVSNNSFANGISPSFSNSYKVYMPNATTLVYEWVAGQEIYDGYWGDKLSLRVPENGVAKALTSKAYVDAGLALKANLASPAFTGTPTAPTATVGTNTTQLATTAFVTSGIATADSGNVKLTGNQTINGIKTFSSSTNFLDVVTKFISITTDNTITTPATGTQFSRRSGLLGIVSSLTPSKDAIIDTSLLSSTDKTFSFPNKSGTFALTSDLSGYLPTPTGLTTNYLPKWNGTGFGNSISFENATGLEIRKFTGVYDSPKILTFSHAENDKYQAYFNFKQEGLPTARMSIGVKSNTVENSDIVTFLPNGNTLFGTTTDNGVDKVQVNGTITASPATASNHVVVKSQLDATRPYKVYTALLSQSGTNAPTAIVLENTLGGTVVWTRTATGEYDATLSNAFTTDKTVCFITIGANTANNIMCFKSYRSTSSVVKLQTYASTSTAGVGAGADSVLLTATFEIRVYL